MTNKHMTQRIFSGIQPTGSLHLGNYLGAMRQWVAMQRDYDSIFCIVDLHAITVPQDPDALRQSIRETAAAFIASGVDPEHCIIFNQSAVAEHTELAWVLNCHTPLGWLDRMTQFKDKSGLSNVDENHRLVKQIAADLREIAEETDNPSEKNVCTRKASGIIRKVEIEGKKIRDKAYLGLYAYPVLMAADILLYKATHVPVGEDQKQHIELARDIAGAFNRAVDQEFFPLPEPVIQGDATRVMSLRDGRAKMSKSDPSDNSRINLTDDRDSIAKKFKKATTDSEAGISYDVEKRPEVSNLLNIYAALRNVPRQQIEQEFAGKGFAEFKPALAELAVETLSPVTDEMRRLLDDQAYIDSVLKRGAEKARAIASSHMREVRDLVGFVQF